MPDRAPLLGLLVAIVIGCQPSPGATAEPTIGPTSVPTAGATPAPSPSAATGIDALVADLAGDGAVAKVGSSFAAEPIGGQGMTVCLGAETLRTYEFLDHDAALAAADTIDRDDPSNIDGGVVEWNGRPRFWLRDRIIVLYLGADPATDAALRALLGPPFAESQEPGRGFLPNPPCQ
jgi:hypothetical protein